ncbi:MAG TPA: hypothetical protein VK324_00550 [Tepidisphaeraceae bacterium]|nr:hypothetical protein [Tepidisphaeraceae bacterium]
MRLQHLIPLIALVTATASAITGCAVSAELGRPPSQRSAHQSSRDDVNSSRPRQMAPAYRDGARPAVEQVQPRVEQNYY